MTPNALICKRCGIGVVRLKTCPRRTIRFRNRATLVIPDDFPIPTCGRCSAEILDADTRAKLSHLLQAEYCAALRVRARQSLGTLVQHLSQRKLEVLLGLSQGYLSRLRAGAGNPSTELVSHLALLAKDPKVRLQELACYWAEPPFNRKLSGGRSAPSTSARRP